MEIKIQIDRKTGLVLLVAFVAGMLGGLIACCLMLRHADMRMFHAGFDGRCVRTMRVESYGTPGQNVIYTSDSSVPAGGSIQVAGSPDTQ
jgi:hypothetical protein